MTNVLVFAVFADADYVRDRAPDAILHTLADAKRHAKELRAM